jgi:hypothetical protein
VDLQPTLFPRAPDPAPGPTTTEDYTPRRPEDAALYDAVSGQLESFLDTARRNGRSVPRFVEREFRTFVDCGILAHGFLRVHCDACGRDRLVPFSCKGRGFCPSCGGRRMADTAAHLIDRVLPAVPVRQWVLTLPFALRYRLAYDAQLASEVLHLFVRAVFRSLRRRARSRRPMANPQCGAVTFVQRFGDGLTLNVHFHTLVLDGVYDPDGEYGIRFIPLPPPDDAEVARVAVRIARRLAKLLERHGLGTGSEDDPGEVDPLYEEQPLLAALYGASVRGRIAVGPRAGQRVIRVGDRVDPELVASGQASRCVSIAGISLHADVCVPARDRARLERLCRYVARPPVASERLSRLPDGRLLYRLRRRWRDGTTHLVFEPLELLEKLAALVPPPRFHLVRYHGILAPRAAWRDAVVPATRATQDEGTCGCAGNDAAEDAAPEDASVEQRQRRHGLQPSRYYSWPDLMRRVFSVDVLECPRCKASPMRILAAIHPPEATRKILEHLGLPARPPPLAPASADSDCSIEAFPD